MNKIFPLQSFRGICCMVVVVVHFTPYEVLFLHNHFLAGIAVLGFFILSGYVLSLNYNINSFKSLINFYRKRFFRLYPLHFLFLLIFLIIEIIKFFIIKHYGIEINSEVFNKNNFYTFVSNLFLVNSLNSSLSYNLPSWAVSSEFMSSILFGLSFFIFKRKHLLFSIIIFIVLFFYFIFNEINLIQYNKLPSLLSCLLCYYLGSILIELNKNNYFIKIIRNNTIQIFNLIFLIYLISIQSYPEIVIFQISIIILYLVNKNLKSLIIVLLTNKYLIYLGNISYSIYLSHFFVYWLITQIFRHILKLESLDSFTNELYIIENIHIYILKMTISIIITVVVSKYLYKYIEKSLPIRK